MKFSKTLKRCIVGTIVLCHAGVLSVPAMAAIEQEAFGRVKPGTEGSVSQSDLEQMQELVKKMQMRLTDLRPTAKTSASQLQKLTQQQESLRVATAKQILELRSNIAQETAKAVADIRQEAQQFKTKKVASSIIARQEQTAKLIEQRQAVMDGLFDQLAAAKDSSSRNAALDKISSQITAWEPKKLQRDFKELPWGRPDSKVPAPVTAQDFNKLAPALEHYQVKNDKISINPKYKPLADASTLSPDELWKQATPTVFTSTSVGQWQKIAFNGMTLSDQNKWPVLASLPVATQTEDLSANEDVQITKEIKDLAAQLKHNPAAIYKWVYDNIEYVPTYGSIQGSAYTLETKRGNATDTSSLLIALLRASGIPARYVSGTIDVPAEVAKDWVGGVNNLSAAGNLIGQGGVPSVIVTSGGKETHLRMEHMWVEAKLDFIPSKGAVQTSGQNNPNIEDSWVPLDASYKRYERAKGIIKTYTNTDAQAIFDAAQDGAIVGTDSIKNLNINNIQRDLNILKEQLNQEISNKPNITVGEIFGYSKIKPYKSKMLSPILPYEVVAVVRDYHTLPDTMRHYFNLNLYDQMSYDFSKKFRIPTTQLKGKQLSFSFKGASKSDEDLLFSYVNKENITSNIVTSSINLKAQLVLDGVSIGEGATYQLGQNVMAQIGFTGPSISFSLAEKQFTAGEHHAVGYNLQGISEKQKQNLSKDLEYAEKYLKDTNNPEPTRNIVGTMLNTIVTTYFSQNELNNTVLGRNFGIVTNSHMSFGTFATAVQGQYSWGILRNAKLGSVFMDIDRISATSVEVENNKSKWIAFNQATGMQMSLNENAIPEMFFNNKNTEKNVDGISAVKALALAAEQGQTIYQINRDNLGSILPKLNINSDTISDIRNAVMSGKIVTVSENEIILNKWKGAGYTVIDPNTGAGGYLISGGLNGGFIEWVKENSTAIALGLSIAGVVASAIPTIGPFLAALIGLIALVLTVASMYWAYEQAMSNSNCPAASGCISLMFILATAIAVGLSILFFFGGVGAAIMSFITGLFAEKLAGGVVGGCDSLACRPTPDF